MKEKGLYRVVNVVMGEWRNKSGVVCRKVYWDGGGWKCVVVAGSRAYVGAKKKTR